MGDRDFFLRLSKICIFECIEKPLAQYRLHGGNLSTIHKEKDVEENEFWLKENKNDLTSSDVKIMQKDINNRKFVNYKIAGNYKKCLKMITNPKTNIFSIKNLVIFFSPIILLKRILWYHQD